jgi:pimeloyl-ACP methyl ester carboxylesterase
MEIGSNRRTIVAGGVAAVAAGVALAQWRHMRSLAADEALRELRAVPRGRPLTATSADGTRLHVEEFGRDDGPTIVLIHGWTEAIRYWTFVIGELAPDFRVVAYDLRGHGESAGAIDDDYSLERFGEDVEAVLAQCVPDRRAAVVAGHSLGAMSIAAWAEHHDVAARTEAAALLNTGLSGLIAGSALVVVPAFAHRFTDPVSRRVILGSMRPVPPFSTPLQHAAIRYTAFGPEAEPALVEFYAGMVAACPPKVRGAIGLAMADMDLDHALARLSVPTLVMAGDRDRLTPSSHARRIADAVPNLAGLIELPATGHMGPLERPSEVAAALRALATGQHPAAGQQPAGGEQQAAPQQTSVARAAR